MRIEQLTRDELWSYVDRLVDLYAIVYAEPPYEEGTEQVERFRRKLPDDAGRPGFAAVVAVDGDSVVAAAYGWTMPAGVWWSRAAEPAPAELAEVDKFAVMEWIVDPRRRGEGLGSAVMRKLLHSRPEPWTTLASDPRSTARAIYARAGWEQVGTSALPWGPPMDLLALPLPGNA